MEGHPRTHPGREGADPHLMHYQEAYDETHDGDLARWVEVACRCGLTAAGSSEEVMAIMGDPEVHQHPKPLTAYIFSEDGIIIAFFLVLALTMAIGVLSTIYLK